MNKTIPKYKWVSVTPEAKAALAGLPKHVRRGQFLVDFGLVEQPVKYQSIGFRLSTSPHPTNPNHTRSIRIINLCNAYDDQMKIIHNYDIKNL